MYKTALAKKKQTNDIVDRLSIVTVFLSIRLIRTGKLFIILIR